MKHTNAETPCPSCEQKLQTAHPDIASWFRDHVKPRYPSCHIAWSYRGKEEQEQAFLDGKTKLHFPNSAHNKTPAEALDLFQLDANGIGQWPWKWFHEIAAEANDSGAPVFWGGQWTHLGDADHYELKRSQS